MKGYGIRRYYERDPKPERLAKVCEQRMNANTVHAMITLNCIVDNLKSVEDAMHERMKTLPTGWRDFRAAKALLHKVLDDLLYTIPEAKFDALAGEMNRTRCDYRQGPAATIKQPTDMVVPTSNVIALCYYAHEYNCKQTCVRESCGSCPLAKALDFCITLDRGKQPWNQIDITQRYEDIADAK